MLKMDKTWFKESKNDVEELYITLQYIQERSPLNKLNSSKGSQGKPMKKTGAACTEERKGKHRERMKQIRERWEK